LSDSVGSS